MVPDKNGNRANVIQGHDNIQDVINSPEPYLSTLVGRYGNRICKGRFQLHGKEYQLPINNGPNCLHGGLKGFNAKVWEALQMNEHTLVLKYVSPYGEEGFSGEMKVTVEYSFTDDNELVIEYMATTNKKTVVNLTSHGFFSLAGIANPTPSIENLECEINADYYLPIDETSIPTGEVRFVRVHHSTSVRRRLLVRTLMPTTNKSRTVQVMTIASCSTRRKRANSALQHVSRSR